MKNCLLHSKLLLILFTCFSYYSTHAQQYTNLVNATLAGERIKNNWTISDINDYLISDQYTDQETGLTHIFTQQRHHHVIVYNAISNFLVKENKVIYFKPLIIDHLASKIKTDMPSVTAEAAIGYALFHLDRNNLTPVKLIRSDSNLNSYIFESPGISSSPIKVQLVYRAMENGIFLAWDVSIEMKNEPHWWNVRVNALTGDFIDKNDFTAECKFGNDSKKFLAHPGELFSAAATAAAPSPFLLPPPVPAYNVFAYPVEAPSFGSRSLLIDPSDPAASPYGWHDVDGIAGNDFTITRGNNVYAYEDANNDNLPGFSPDTANLQFNYSFTSGVAPINNQKTSITNLFYINNRLHDVLYYLGFNEAAGNFQQNNYGNGGLGNDYVKAEAFDGGGSNNANFSTPADGFSGRMQMYLWSGSPQLDGSLDNGIISHEFGHGVSNRLTGGPSQAGCLGNAEQGGEGWSDWLALMMTIEPGDSGAMARGMATYVKGQPTTGSGIRRFPYSTNMSINPQTYANVASSTEVHNIGEIWCDAIWDMSWFLINDLGFNPDPTVITSGNNIAIRLVLEGMKLQPCGPGFLDARDAILTADAVLYNNAHRCRIWEAFARRGMGYNAVQGSANSATDQTAGFAMPPFCLPATQIPVAAFTSNVTTVACGGNVQFIDQSVQPFNWLWNFGDQATSTLQNPSHAFTSPGSYTVNLVVTNPLGTDSITHTITVTSTFTATASASPTTLCAGSPVQLNASASGSSNITYSVTNIPYAPLTGTLIPVSLTDDVMSTVKPIGFSFNFFGQSYSNFYICSNGFITFSAGQTPNVVYGVPIPSSASPNNFIAAAWNDLNPSNPGSSVGYFNTGVSPNKKLVVQYTTSHYGGTIYPFVVQAILSEGSNLIEIHTTTISDASAFDPSATTTQGVENANGSAGVAVPGRNGTIFSASNDAYRFTPVVDYSYTWQPGNLAGAAQTVVPASTGAYSVNVTDGSGCTITASSPLITVNPLPAPVITGNTTFCAGSSTTLNAGTFTGYLWSTGVSTQTISVNTAGTFTVTVTNASGCSASASVITTTNICCSISLSGTLTAVTCNGGNNGSINVSSSNNTGSSAYLWNDGSTTEDRTGLSAGSYTVTVTYGAVCSQSQSFTVTQPLAVTASATQTNIVCKGINTGSISMSPSGGTPGYTYLWNNGATSQNRSSLGIGTYTVTVKDANLCSATASFTITQPATSLVINISKTNIRCPGGLTGIITASPAGGTSPFSYSWNTFPVSTTATISGLSPGAYTVVVTDGIGCTKTTTTTITQPPSIVVVQSQTNVTFPGGNNGTASVAVSGGTPGYTYNWNTIPTQTTAGITGLAPGVYKCTIYDSKMCPVKVSFTITEPFSKEQNEFNSGNQEQHLFVYPNPSDGIIAIKLSGLDNKNNVEFNLYDIAGRKVYSSNLAWKSDEMKMFDFSMLPKGIYYVKCISEKNNLIQKIVIQ